MNTIIPHIEYLLQNHDCVIIPGIGALLAFGECAYYAEEEGIWHAPRRVVSFNPELSRSDGLIASSIARREDISIEAAAVKLNAAVKSMRAELESTRRLSLGAAGTLSIDSEGYFSFEPGECAWLSPTHMWLPDFAMSPVVRASEIERESQRERRMARLPFNLMKAAQVAACACVLVILGWVVAKNLSYNPEDQYATFAPTATLRASANSMQSAPATLILACAPADEQVENIVVDNSLKPGPSHSYFLVIASLATRGEAEKFISQNHELKLGILEKDGRFRIYAATGSSAAEAMDAFKESEAASRYPNSWVCRR